MARKPDTSQYRDFDQILTRLDTLVDQVRHKDTSLERSLDLFEEAVALSAKGVEMVDVTNFTPAELEQLRDESTSATDTAGDDATNKDA